MSFRFRIAAWMVFSSIILIAVMIFVAHRQLEEELREGRKDNSHPQFDEWTLHNSFAEDEIKDILEELTEKWLWSAVPLIGLSLASGLLLARRSLRPVHDINRQLSTMQPDSLHGGIIIPETDPAIEDLANHLNVLLDRAGTAYHEMAEFSARVAHELRTPLMLLRMRVEHAPAGIPPAFQEDLQDELARLSRFVERSLLAAKAAQGSLEAKPERLPLSELIRDVADDYQLLATEQGKTMHIQIEPNLWIHNDPDLLRQLLHGLLENTVRYAKSEIHVRCQTQGKQATLEIRNNLEPLSMATSGLGLGLRLIRGICKVCSWELHCHQSENSYESKVCFTLNSTNDSLPSA